MCESDNHYTREVRLDWGPSGGRPVERLPPAGSGTAWPCCADPGAGAGGPLPSLSLQPSLHMLGGRSPIATLRVRPLRSHLEAGSTQPRAGPPCGLSLPWPHSGHTGSWCGHWGPSAGSGPGPPEHHCLLLRRSCPGQRGFPSSSVSWKIPLRSALLFL